MLLYLLEASGWSLVSAEEHPYPHTAGKGCNNEINTFQYYPILKQTDT